MIASFILRCNSWMDSLAVILFPLYYSIYYSTYYAILPLMELTDKNYQNIIKNNDTPVFIDFYSPTCGPCQMLIKLIDERLTAYGEENGIQIVKCDISKNPKLASAFNVRSVPFTIAVMPDDFHIHNSLQV